MAKSGHGMFLWPTDEHRAAAWTKQVQQTLADIGGQPRSMKLMICGQHFEKSCLDPLIELARETGFSQADGYVI